VGQLKIGILGSGFGLYGYLPAAFKNGWQINTLSRYKQSIAARPEIAAMEPFVIYHSDERRLIENVDCLVIARNPEMQSQTLTTYADFRGHLFLEKPLGTRISEHEKLLGQLVHLKSKFSTGYLFCYLNWYFKVITFMKTEDEGTVTVLWQIDKPMQSWKLDSEFGGGLVSYYAVHLVRLFEDLLIPIDSIEIDENSSEKLKFHGQTGKKRLRIEITFSTQSRFQIDFEHEIYSEFPQVDLESPFGILPRRDIVDPRVESLSKYLIDGLYEQTIEQAIMTEGNVIIFRKRFADTT
jgi:predicted dehydrogenase